MTVESDYKDQVSAAKGDAVKFKQLWQAADTLNDRNKKVIGELQDQAASIPALKAELASEKEASANKDARIAHLTASVASLQAGQDKAERVFAAFKAFKQILDGV